MEEEQDFDRAIVNEGEAAGRRRGEEIGLENGMKHGREDAHQICFELGFAQGVALACQNPRLGGTQTASLYPQARALEDSVANTKWEDTPAPSETQMRQVRSKFKVLDSRANLGLGRFRGSGEDLSF